MHGPTTVSEIGQIALTFRDVAAAKHFYVDVLGLQPLFDAGPRLSFVAAGSVRIMLSAPEGAGDQGKNSILYFKTPNIEETYQAVVARGAAAEQSPRPVAKLPDHELWLAFVRDPEANLIGLMEERR